MEPIEFTMPGVRLVTESNNNEHWRVRQKRAREHRNITRICALSMLTKRPDWILPLTITITRIAPRPIHDDDNLVSSAKHVRDGIADALGVNDRDKRITWVVKQEKGKSKEYAARVRIEARKSKKAASDDAAKLREAVAPIALVADALMLSNAAHPHVFRDDEVISIGYWRDEMPRNFVPVLALKVGDFRRLKEAVGR